MEATAKSRTLEQLVDDLIREARSPFTAGLFVKKMRERWRRRIAPATISNLLQRLDEHELLIGEEEKEFLPYKAVFEKMGRVPLAIPLTGLELQRKILIPGYRLIPYLSHNVPENEITLLNKDGEKIPQLKCAFSLEDAFELYRYSNERHFPDDIKINEWLPGKSSLSLSAWDIS